VKEFEAGSHASVVFMIQRTIGTEVGEGNETSLELMCGHVAYLSEHFVHLGAKVDLPQVELSDHPRGDRVMEIYEGLASIQADSHHGLAEDVREASRKLMPGSSVFVLLAVADPTLPPAISALAGSGIRIVPLVYDAHSFGTRKKRVTAEPAVSAPFLDQLRAAGTVPVIMPGYGSVA
jgi:hypothetical protein